MAQPSPPCLSKLYAQPIPVGVDLHFACIACHDLSRQPRLQDRRDVPQERRYVRPPKIPSIWRLFTHRHRIAQDIKDRMAAAEVEKDPSERLGRFTESGYLQPAHAKCPQQAGRNRLPVDAGVELQSKDYQVAVPALSGQRGMAHNLRSLIEDHVQAPIERWAGRTYFARDGLVPTGDVMPPNLFRCFVPDKTGCGGQVVEPHQLWNVVERGYRRLSAPLSPSGGLGSAAPAPAGRLRGRAHTPVAELPVEVANAGDRQHKLPSTGCAPRPS